MFREWQDLRAAISYWKNNLTRYQTWHIDSDKIYVLGHGSGGITALNNAVLTQNVLNDEKGSGQFLEPITGGFTFPTLAEDIVLNALTGEMASELKDTEKEVKEFCAETDKVRDLVKVFQILFPDENIDDDESCSALVSRFENLLANEIDFSTYDLEAYPTYPCIGSGSDPCTLSDADKQAYESSIATADKVISLSGAIAKLDWLDQVDVPISNIYHKDDDVISTEEGEPFGNLLYLFEEADWYINSTSAFPRFFGGKSMTDYTNKPVNYDNLELTGEWHAGGPPYHHDPQVKFGFGYKRGEGIVPRLEQKVLFYIDAFFTKDHSSGTANRILVEEDEKTDPVEDLISPLLFPNPSLEDYVNLKFRAESKGALQVELTDLTGKLLGRTTYDTIDGINEIKLNIEGLSSGIVIVYVKGSGVSFSRRLIVK